MLRRRLGYVSGSSRGCCLATLDRFGVAQMICHFQCVAIFNPEENVSNYQSFGKHRLCSISNMATYMLYLSSHTLVLHWTVTCSSRIWPWKPTVLKFLSLRLPNIDIYWHNHWQNNDGDNCEKRSLFPKLGIVHRPPLISSSRLTLPTRLLATTYITLVNNRNDSKLHEEEEKNKATQDETNPTFKWQNCWKPA